MPTYTIKQHHIWQGGKLRKEGETVELTEKDRERIDPQHDQLQSAEEAAAEAAKAQIEADLAKARAHALAKVEADHKAKLSKKEGAK